MGGSTAFTERRSDDPPLACAACGYVNAGDASFCGGCGNDRRTPNCARCGRPSAGSRFCQGCGAPLTADVAGGPPPATAAFDIETRLATVESGLVELQAEVNSLIGLRLQLQQTLEARRNQRPGATRAPARPVARPASSAIDFASDPVPEAPADEPAKPVARSTAEPATVRHFDDVPAITNAVRAAVERLGGVYNPAPSTPANVRRQLVAVNLLLASADPFAVVMAASSEATDGPTAFTYGADAEHSLVLGMVPYIPPPFDADLCVTRLLKHREGPQKVLIVCESVEVSTELRGVLGRFGSTVSMAFSARQAAELVPLVEPDIVLVDLDLPRGEAWRTVARVRSDPLTRRLPLAFMWQKPVNVDELRQHLARVIRDFPPALDDLCQGLRRELSPLGPR